MTDYCEQRDLFDFGLPRGAVPNPGRPASAVSAVTDAITLPEHGLDTGSPFRVRAEAGGALPGGLVASTQYYAIPVNEVAFKAAATAELAAAGTAIDFTTDGTRVIVICPLPVAAAISWASRILEENTPAHALTTPIASIVRMTCAELAAGKLGLVTGASSKSLTAIVDDAKKRLEKWAKGVPIRGDTTSPRTYTAVSGTQRGSDRRGWRRFGGLC